MGIKYARTNESNLLCIEIGEDECRLENNTKTKMEDKYSRNESDLICVKRTHCLDENNKAIRMGIG